MNLWGAAPLLAAVLLGGGVHSNTKPVTLAAGPVVQIGTGTWTTTVELNNNSPACPPKSDFALETTSPSGLIPATHRTEVQPAQTSAAKGTAAKNGKVPAPPCDEVTLSFQAPPQMPGAAVLEFHAAGAAPASMAASFSRPVSVGDYLAIPAAAGLAMVLVLLGLALVFVRIYDWDSKPIPGAQRSDGRGFSPRWPDGKYWQYIVAASGAWTASDSWATNIAPVIGILATAFSVTTAASALFPGVDLGRFELLNLAAITIITATPFAFSILYAKWTAKNPGLTTDSAIVPPVLLADFAAAGSLPPAAVTVSTPVGATLTVPGGAAVGGVDEKEEIAWITPRGEAALIIEVTHMGAVPKYLKDGATVQVPPRSMLDVIPGECMALPGVADLVVAGDSALRITFSDDALLALPADQLSGTTAAAKSNGPDEAPGAGAGKGAQGGKPADTPLGSPVWVLAPGGAKVTVNGTANVVLPTGTNVTAPRREEYRLEADRHVLVPQGSNTMVANMRLVIASALMTIFGIGIQVGIAGVLAFGYSDASPAGRWLALLVVVVVAVFTLIYSTMAIRTLADPQPGSSLSAVSGTSFTL
jgi:hypothetical protein